MALPRVLSSEQMKIDCEDDVVLVRRRVRAVAEERGFDPFAVAAITTAASELARNVWAHAMKGRTTLEVLLDGERAGISLRFEDEGPGIAALDRALAGGFSTRNSLGLGLSGSRRLVDDFDVQTSPGSGTCVRVVKWARF
jgi:serine/threonine-protein kinase RsbT